MGIHTHIHFNILIHSLLDAISTPRCLVEGSCSVVHPYRNYSLAYDLNLYCGRERNVLSFKHKIDAFLGMLTVAARQKN